MTVRFLTGLSGRNAQSFSAQGGQAAAQGGAANSPAATSQFSRTDAAITNIRTSRADSGERLNAEKAEKVAKGVAEEIRKDKAAALGAYSGDFSTANIRDAFGP